MARPKCPIGKSGSWRHEQEAISALIFIQATTHRRIVPKRVYRCHRCRWWHLTSQEKRNPLA